MFILQNMSTKEKISAKFFHWFSKVIKIMTKLIVNKILDTKESMKTFVCSTSQEDSLKIYS